MGNRFFPSYKSYIITSKFGMRKHPILKINKMHNGVDMTATNDGKTGQPDYITAHTGGTVEAVGYGVSAGNYIKIRVDSKTVMVYYHLKAKPNFEVGAMILTGQRIGYMGQTGTAKGKHLHFGIQYEGKWIDPQPYLDKAWEQPVKYITLDVPVLKRGMKGDAVRALQAQLVGYGYQIVVDGSFGAKTENAVMCYQEDNGLTPDGSVGRKTRSAMLGIN